MAKQLIKIGNSLGLTLPASAVSGLNLKPGDEVEVYSDGKSLHLVPVKQVKAVSLGGLWKDVDLSEDDWNGLVTIW